MKMNQEKLCFWLLQLVALIFMGIIAVIYDGQWLNTFFLICGGLLGVNVYLEVQHARK